MFERFFLLSETKALNTKNFQLEKFFVVTIQKICYYELG